MHDVVKHLENVQKKLANVENIKKGGTARCGKATNSTATVDSYPDTNTHCNV